MKTYTPWPDDGKTADFEALVTPIRKALEFGYKLERINGDQDVPYDGFNIGEREQVTSLSPHEALTSESLQENEQSQGVVRLTATRKPERKHEIPKEITGGLS